MLKDARLKVAYSKQLIWNWIITTDNFLIFDNIKKKKETRFFNSVMLNEAKQERIYACWLWIIKFSK